MTPQGEVRLRRAVVALDCGIAINPSSIEAQVQGGLLFGWGAALYNGITLKQGAIEQSNFHDYRSLRIDEVPSIEVYRIENNEKPGGLGEVGTAIAAPALNNAVFAATGVRLRTLPIDRTVARAKSRCIENRSDLRQCQAHAHAMKARASYERMAWQGLQGCGGRPERGRCSSACIEANAQNSGRLLRPGEFTRRAAATPSRRSARWSRRPHPFRVRVVRFDGQHGEGFHMVVHRRELGEATGASVCQMHRLANGPGARRQLEAEQAALDPAEVLGTGDDFLPRVATLGKTDAVEQIEIEHLCHEHFARGGIHLGQSRTNIGEAPRMVGRHRCGRVARYSVVRESLARADDPIGGRAWHRRGPPPRHRLP